MDKKREAFEKWFDEKYPCPDTDIQRTTKGIAYFAWQAAQADKIDLLNALKAAIEWIDAVPSETVLPIMPGFDRDDVDELIYKAE